MPDVTDAATAVALGYPMPDGVALASNERGTTPRHCLITLRPTPRRRCDRICCGVDMPDISLTHVALFVKDLDRAVDFYERYAAMQTVHRRTDAPTRSRVAWISDRTRPFVLVLVEVPKLVPRWLLKAVTKF